MKKPNILMTVTDQQQRDTSGAYGSRLAQDLKALRYKMVGRLAKTREHLYNAWNVYWLTDDMAVALKAPGRRSTPVG